MAASREREAPGCPVCGKPADAAFRPFCSKRCSDVDLQRWLSGRYAIPGDEETSPGEDDDAPEPRRAP